VFVALRSWDIPSGQDVEDAAQLAETTLLQCMRQLGTLCGAPPSSTTAPGGGSASLSSLDSHASRMQLNAVMVKLSAVLEAASSQLRDFQFRVAPGSTPLALAGAMGAPFGAAGTREKLAAMLANVLRFVETRVLLA
jgi:hypothetical protein